MADVLNQYKLLRMQLDRRLAEAIEKARREHEDGLQALNTFWRLANGPVPDDEASVERGHGDLINAVRELVGTMGGSFSIHDIEREISMRYPLFAAEPNQDTLRKSISSALRRLFEGGSLRKLEEGRGTRPTTYIRTKEAEMSTVSGRQA